MADTIADAQTLLAEWDIAATPDDAGCHNAGGFALHNAARIRSILGEIVNATERARTSERQPEKIAADAVQAWMAQARARDRAYVNGDLQEVALAAVHAAHGTAH